MKPADIKELKKGGVVKLKEKDMFSVWVKAACDNMDAVKLRKVAEIAEKYARGMILFTSRQFPIIPFVHIKNILTVKDELGDGEPIVTVPRSLKEDGHKILSLKQVEGYYKVIIERC